MNPNTLRQAARLGKNARRVEAIDAHAAAWEADIDTKNKLIIGVNALVADNAALRQRLEEAEKALWTVREFLRDGYMGSKRDAMTVLDAALAAGEGT